MTAPVSEDLDQVRTLAPGPDLAAVLAGIDDRQLDHRGQLDVIAAWSRLRSWAEARELRATAALAGPPDDERPATAALLASRLHVPHQTAAERIELAWTLATERVQTLRGLHTGALSLAHARTIAEEVHHLEPDDADTVEAAVLPDAGTRTAASLRRTLRRRCLAIDPAAQTRRHQEAVKERATWLRDLGDGMTEFGARLPTADALRCSEAVNAAARDLRTSRDDRTADQRRADAFTHLLTGGHAPTVNIVISAKDDHPAVVPGFGPLDADTLRELCNAATIVLRPLGLAPTAVTTYRPTASLDHWIRARDKTCRFPGCAVRSADCDLDHVIPWHQGGRTAARNLMPLCRKHHRLKTFRDWRPTLQSDRAVTWTDPTGRRHHVPPPDS